MNITLRTAALLGVFVLIGGQVEAQELNICEPASAGARRHLITLLSHDQTGPSSPFANLHMVISIDEDGFAFAVGSIQIHNGVSNTFLVGEKDVRPALSCTDIDQNARTGLISAQFTMRDTRTGEPVLVTILPVDGEIDENGTELVTLVISTTTSVQTLQVRQTTIVQDI